MKFNGQNRNDGRDIGDRRIHLAVGKHRDRAIVIGFARVLVNQFVQLRTRRHRVQQQNKCDQQRGENRLAMRFEMTLYELQIVCNIAKRFSDARFLLILIRKF